MAAYVSYTYNNTLKASNIEFYGGCFTSIVIVSYAGLIFSFADINICLRIYISAAKERALELQNYKSRGELGGNKNPP